MPVKTPEYRCWLRMKERCYNKNNRSYRDYGGRGIRVCLRWGRSFQAFLAHVGKRPHPKLSIERMNNSRGYYPGNVKWATRIEQGRNKRNNNIVVFRGVAKPLIVWIEKLGLNYETVLRRIDKLGWSPERALTQPPRKRRPPLTISERRQIVRLYATGRWSQDALAAKFGYRDGQANICRVLREGRK